MHCARRFSERAVAVAPANLHLSYRRARFLPGARRREVPPHDLTGLPERLLARM